MKTKKKVSDANSKVNQDIKGRFVAREVKACFSYEMDAILKQATNGGNSDLPDYDQIENLYEYKCPDCGNGVQDLDDVRNEEGLTTLYVCPDCKHESADEWEQEPQEIFEWWIVTEFLYDKLKAKGNPVIEWGNNFYWGRCTTGQAILLDGVITDICRDMEILEGQKYSWAEGK